jgi:O-antigen/teichoic acid export membrane protein
MSLLKIFQAKINRSEFVKNTAVLVSGTTIAQMLPLAITPILSRMYNAEDFGA